jgi:DNA-binding NtrC family response regulator
MDMAHPYLLQKNDSTCGRALTLELELGAIIPKGCGVGDEMKQLSRKMLIADDNASHRSLVARVFEKRGFTVTAARNGDEAVRLLREKDFDVVITDLRMPGRDGMAVLKASRESAPERPVIIVTGHGSIEAAVEAMRRGASDFLTKDYELDEIERKVERLLGSPASRPAAAPAPTVASEPRRIVGVSAATKHLLRMIRRIGPGRGSVIITGPTGSGKELVARGIHEASTRREGPFIALNCAALPSSVLDSELFGHEKGAFTGAESRRRGRFERANGGTLFLDEVGEMPPETQAKLLRVLQEGEYERVGGSETLRVDVRIVAATHRDLTEALASGRLREDFYYRLNVFSIHVPPLSSRREDIPPLVEHFLRAFHDETGKALEGVDADVMDVFMRYPWPGNIRQLKNVLERAVVLAEGPTIRLDDIPPELILPGQGEDGPPTPGEPRASLAEHTASLEREMIREALERHHWNRTKTAAYLGMKRTTLQYRMMKLGLE